jgi:hypothetical protein
MQYIRILSIGVIVFSLFSKPFYAEKITYNGTVWASKESKKLLGSSQHFHNKSKEVLGLSFEKKMNKISSNLSLTFLKNKNIWLDKSYLKYQIKNITFGVGKINRKWSFSPNTSLFLSKNARPAKSIFLKIENKYRSKNPLFGLAGPTTFEIFNSVLKNSSGPKNSLALGVRITSMPTHKLNLEIIKISQWGGDGYKNGPTEFVHAALGNSNEGPNSNINQTAGFGISYTPKNSFPLRVYGQVLGEDEAGSLPSCLIYLAGFEFDKPLRNFNNRFGFEVVDTRVDKTTNGFCGKNTAYNNGVYKYSNYDAVIGAPIDTESKSLSVWNSVQISQELDIMYSIQSVLINDTNFINHRLSPQRQRGYINNLLVTWEKNKIKFIARISHQDIELTKANISKGLSIGLSSSINF